MFSPVVEVSKKALGNEELNKLRGDVIAAHSKVISKFVETSESKFGRIALRKLFDAADTDGNGTLDKAEVLARRSPLALRHARLGPDKERGKTKARLFSTQVREALNALGFSWLKTDQVETLVKRSDVDENAVIDFEEFVLAAPKTLRTNLIKLAKQNGNDLGFLV